MGTVSKRVRRGNNGAGKEVLEALEEKVQAALKVMTSEEAEGIIGEKPPILSTLLDGVTASVGMLWSTALASGARKKPKTLRMWGASQVVLATLVLYAFAAGMRMGREAGDSSLRSE